VNLCFDFEDWKVDAENSAIQIELEICYPVSEGGRDPAPDA